MQKFLSILRYIINIMAGVQNIRNLEIQKFSYLPFAVQRQFEHFPDELEGHIKDFRNPLIQKNPKNTIIKFTSHFVTKIMIKMQVKLWSKLLKTAF